MKYQIVKTIHINKGINEVRGLIQDFSHWDNWSPWRVIEPTSDQSIEGQPASIGHKMSWDGKLIGAGSMTVKELSDTSFICDLLFTKPFKAQALTSFDLQEENEGTTVTWTMDSSMPFFLAFMIPMTKMMVSMDFDRGLKMLKAVAEQGSVQAKTTNKGVTDFEGFSYIGIQRTLPFDQMKQMQDDFQKIIQDIVVGQGVGARHWVALYPKMHPKTMSMTYIAAISDEQVDKSKLGDEYISGEIASTKALEIFHKGSYDFIGTAWNMGAMTMRAEKMKKAGVPFEYYRNSPLEVKPEELETSIFFPTK